MTIDSPSKEYLQMAEQWKLPLTLLGGTQAMRDAGRTYLPQEPKESNEAYAVRKQRTFLFNVYKRTIQSLAGQAMIKSVVVNNVPPQLAGMEWNFDGTGRSVTDVAYDLFMDMMVFGKTHAYTDFPIIEEANIRNYAEYRESGLLPYVVHVSPKNLIGWRVDYSAGIPNLQSIRIYSESLEEDPLDEFNDILVKRIQVVRPNIVDHWVNSGEGWEQEDSTPNNFGFVPLMTSYAAKTGFLTAEPPLEDLAWMNLRHWQSSSDQNNILHVARVPFILATGFEEGDLNNAELGINRLVATSSAEANMKFVEHTGSAINAGRTDLRDIEQQMATIGADLIMNKSISRQTATARQIDRSESLSVIQIALRNLETMLENLYMTAGILMGVNAEDVSVTIGADLNMADEPNPTLALLQLRELGFDEEVILSEAQRRGLLAEYVKAADIDLSMYHRDKELDIMLKEQQLQDSEEEEVMNEEVEIETEEDTEN